MRRVTGWPRYTAPFLRTSVWVTTGGGGWIVWDESGPTSRDLQRADFGCELNFLSVLMRERDAVWTAIDSIMATRGGGAYGDRIVIVPHVLGVIRLEEDEDVLPVDAQAGYHVYHVLQPLMLPGMLAPPGDTLQREHTTGVGFYVDQVPGGKAVTRIENITRQ